MICSLLCNSASIIFVNNNKLSSVRGRRHPQLTHSSYYPIITNHSTKSEVSMDSMPKTHDSAFESLSKKPYAPPSWAASLSPVPSHIFSLGHFPTPIHKWNLPNLPKGAQVYLKRDDLSGMQLSGNKVRKLEFLLAEAVAEGADCIITIGGIQSNHCRATAVAAKYLNLDCYLILRTSKALVDKDPGLTGNLLVERLVGAHVDLVSKEEYASVGSVALTNILKEKLLSEGRKPYVIPVGGSNSLGTWGYVEAVREIKQQLTKGNNELAFDDIIVACGSGGTIAGLSVGTWLSGLGAKVHAYCVCDDPDYFYDYVQGLIDGLEARVSSRDIVNIQNAKGLGYAMNTAEELNFVQEIAKATGIVLDPVYSGKAAYGMMRDMAENPGKWEGRKVLFVHTGGLLGLYEKTEQIAPLVGNWRRMDVHESIPRKEGTVSSSIHHGIIAYCSSFFMPKSDAPASIKPFCCLFISPTTYCTFDMGSLLETQLPEFEFLAKKPYVPPSWAAHLNPTPSHVFSLGHFPTPIHKWNLPDLPKDTEVYVKRDDLSGMQLSGNKVRKLEFLMAEAVAKGADCVITIGGVQSNHCRATAVAAKYLKLDCYLILRTSKDEVDKDPGLGGNLLVERLAGARIELVSEQDYARVGRVELTNILKEKLLSEGRKPYVIPMGGSTPLATWGYIEAVREIQQQLQEGGTVGATFDDIVVACGSGCTGVGLALGSQLSGLGAQVQAYSSWGEPDYFYDYAQSLLDGLQSGLSSYDILNIRDAKGLGYAINTEEELRFLTKISQETGIILDPVYSGKALYQLKREMDDDPVRWEGRKVLFIHTGGLLSLFDKADAVSPLLGNWRTMDIHTHTN